MFFTSRRASILAAGLLVVSITVQADPEESEQVQLNAQLKNLEARLSAAEKEFQERKRVWIKTHPRLKAIEKDIRNFRAQIEVLRAASERNSK